MSEIMLEIRNVRQGYEFQITDVINDVLDALANEDIIDDSNDDSWTWTFRTGR